MCILSIRLKKIQFYQSIIADYLFLNQYKYYFRIFTSVIRVSSFFLSERYDNNLYFQPDVASFQITSGTRSRSASGIFMGNLISHIPNSNQFICRTQHSHFHRDIHHINKRNKRFV